MVQAGALARREKLQIFTHHKHPETAPQSLYGLPSPFLLLPRTNTLSFY